VKNEGEEQRKYTSYMCSFIPPYILYAVWFILFEIFFYKLLHVTRDPSSFCF